MNTFFRLVLATILLVAKPLLAQHLPYTYSLTEPDQELDSFGGKYVGVHKISARLRGVRGTDSTLYWVSLDGSRLTAYKRGQRLWQADVSQAFAHVLTSAKIDRLIFSSNVVFVSTARGGHAEIDRTTGIVAAVGVDAK